MVPTPHRLAAAACALLVCAAACLPGCVGSGSGSLSPSARAAEAARAQSRASGPQVRGGDLVPVRYTGPELPLTDRAGTRPPIDLVTPDGIKLGLRDLVSRTVVQGPLAFTELRLTFVNPEPRVVEGRFRITLPTGAAISRFAMKIGGRWQEGEVVEEQRAREAYEDFLHRKQDPALLERAAGNEFSARVFPIPAGAEKELVLSYSQEIAGTRELTGSRELTGGRAILVPLRGLPELQLVDVSVTRDGQAEALDGYRKAAYAPAEDFGLALGAAGVADGLRSGELAVARVSPPVSPLPDPLQSAVVLVDTSGSRALGFGVELELVQMLARHVAARGGPGAALVVATFDQTTEPVFAGRAADFGASHLSSIARRGALGASDLERALRWAASAARQSGAQRVVLVSDGVATAGKSDAQAIRQAVAALKEAAVQRLDAVAVGGIRDQEALRAAVTGGLERDGVVADGELPTAAIARRLDAATASKLTVAVPGASWFWPRQLDGIQPGDQVLVHAELPEGQALRVWVGGKELAQPELVPVARPLLERSWARAKLSSLLAREADEGRSAELRRQIVALSTRHRVLSPYTSLLVLETEQDYERFHIDRTALADILTIESGQLRHLHRPTLDMPKPTPPALAQGRLERPQPPPRPSDGREGGTGSRARGEEGSMGTAATRSAAADLGADPLSARGNMWGDPIGESFGASGLGLSGIGEGGGGRGEAIGLGRVGTLGRGAGSGSGQGLGSGHGRITSSHSQRAPQVRMGASTVAGRLPPEVIQRVVRQSFGGLRACYETALAQSPGLQGRVVVRFLIERGGRVGSASTAGSELADDEMLRCVARHFYTMTFPAPEGGLVTVSYPLVFAPEGTVIAPPELPVAESTPSPRPPPPATLQGPLADVMNAIDENRVNDALARASAWHVKEPGDVLALVGLGRAYEAAGAPDQASRAYGSIIDLYPWRADQRRFAGGNLERLGIASALELGLDSYLQAQQQRPDHPSSHRMLAMAWLKKGEPGKAFDVLQAALARRYPGGRFAGVERVLREDLGLAAAAWIKAEPKRSEEIAGRLRSAGGELDTAPSLRFVLSWETDSNDVDLHVYDTIGGHAYYADRTLPSGGELYADVTTGYGPECFTVRSPSKERASSYRIKVQYYARGPMGYGMGKVEVVRHDGRGGLSFEQRPFVVMNGGAEADLGPVAI
jgi:hypothetical protein